MPKKLLVSISLAFICSCSSNDSNEEPQQPSSSSVAETPSSSSIVQSSSSSGGQAVNCTEAYNPATHFCDKRDGNLYKIVKIGEQVWFAENLNYNASGSRCYDDLQSNCEKYGRHYDWATAMVLDKECNEMDCSGRVSYMHKGICPEGWHVASQGDWGALANSAYEDNSFYTLGGICIDKCSDGVRKYCNNAGVRGYYWSDVSTAGWFMVTGEVYTNPSATCGMIYMELIMNSVRCVQGEWKSYRVDFNTNGGTPETIPYVVIDSGSTYWGNKYPENPAKIGYTFGGWFDGDMQYTNITPRTKDVTLIAKWNKLEEGGKGEDYTDTRNSQSQIYPTVILNGKRWFAKNLNFNASGSLCHSNLQANCDKHGRLYTWDIANSVACPSGWHLPTNDEWVDLIEFAGGYEFAGRALKSKTDWDGNDDFNFSALPGGSHNGITFEYGVTYEYIGLAGLWWTSTKFEGSPLYKSVLSFNDDIGGGVDMLAEYSLSVRCVED
ncbi:MAG: InlB B-repeat-containing protein [Fibromonadales bacterium]|nr:InlB B-repeat-containing protein [Fibromonadales bacterium]